MVKFPSLREIVEQINPSCLSHGQTCPKFIYTFTLLCCEPSGPGPPRIVDPAPHHGVDRLKLKQKGPIHRPGRWFLGPLPSGLVVGGCVKISIRGVSPMCIVH